MSNFKKVVIYKKSTNEETTTTIVVVKGFLFILFLSLKNSLISVTINTTRKNLKIVLTNNLLFVKIILFLSMLILVCTRFLHPSVLFMLNFNKYFTLNNISKPISIKIWPRSYSTSLWPRGIMCALWRRRPYPRRRSL